ncbi:unnamed protein product, partial [Mesorhabditis spiculigera]
MFFLIFFGAVAAWVTFFFLRIKWEEEKLDDLPNRPVFITGCDSGFGHDAALKLLSMGMPVFAGCYTEEGLEKIEKEASNYTKGKFKAIRLDVTNDESVDRMGTWLEKEVQPYGGLWAVINNAGVGFNVFLDDFLKHEDYRLTMEINFYGIMRVVHRLRRALKQRKGRLINVTSILGRCPAAGIGPYIISKFTANVYTEVIRKELAIWGVEVIHIEPGFVKTPLTDTERIRKNNEHLWERASPELKAEYGYEFFKKIVNIYVKAVTSVNTRRRYKVGIDTNFL